MINNSSVVFKNQNKQKSRPSLLGRSFLWLFIVVAVFVGFGLLARIPQLQVSVGNYENIIVTNTEDVTKSLMEYFNERFLYPKSNRLWFSNRRAEKYIETKFPRIASVDVSLLKSKLSISGEEREGRYLWCGNVVVPVRLDTPCYFVDHTGFIFDIAPYFSGTSYLRLYGGVANDTPIGSQAFSSEIFELHEVMDKTLKSFGLKIQAIVLLPENQIEFLLSSNNTITQAPKVKYYLVNDSDIVIQNIQEALKQENVLLDITTNYDRLEYLDTRFKNQIVYKFFDTYKDSEIHENILEQTDTEIQENQADTSSTEE